MFPLILLIYQNISVSNVMYTPEENGLMTKINNDDKIAKLEIPHNSALVFFCEVRISSANDTKLPQKMTLNCLNIMRGFQKPQVKRIRSVPGKRVFPVSISAMIQPTDHISTATRG